MTFDRLGNRLQPEPARIPLGRKGNTVVRADGNDTVVRLYSTDIVRVNAERVILDTGGYSSTTTKRRMNQAAAEFGLGFAVYQKRGIWFVQRAGSVEPLVVPACGRIEFPRGYSAKPIDVHEARPLAD